MQLTVSDWPEGFASVGFDSVVANKGQLGTGLEIRDNIVAHNRGRGLLIKAGGGTVSGNSIVDPAWWGIMVRHFTGSCHVFTSCCCFTVCLISSLISALDWSVTFLWAMQVMPETAWQEADWVSNLNISNNTVDANFGGIFVGLIRPNNLGSGQFLNHANVSILGNTVANASYAPIMITSTQGVVIGNNTIRDCLCQPPPYGQGFTCV